MKIIPVKAPDTKVWYMGKLISWAEWCALPWEKRHESNNVMRRKK